MGAHFKLNASHRAAIEDQIESLIALLDMMDGDCGLEDGHDREAVNEDGSDTLSRMLPRYAVDQTGGPINAAIAARADLIADRGLLPDGRGGWRHAQFIGASHR